MDKRTQSNIESLLKMESQRLLLMFRIKELETGTRPTLEELFPTQSANARRTMHTKALSNNKESSLDTDNSIDS